METAAAKLSPQPDGSRLEPLPKTTVGEIVTGRRLPTRGKLIAFLAVCKVAPDGQDPWLEAWERARTAGLAWAAGRVRVRAAEPRRLGVHAAISVPGVPDDVPPRYVPRDVDAAEFGVRARVEAAERAGGFVLLVGGSSVGKTRCAVEAVKALLPQWWLVHPAGPDQVTALAQAPPPRTVVWLDELQRYLDGEDGLTGGVVRALLHGPHPVVIIGTLWPDRYHAYTAVPAPGGPDPREREREVLDLADVVRIAPEFSPAEQDRARAAAAGDRRLAVALGAAGYGLTQTLAAAPQLVARWADAKTGDPYGWAVLTAALDVARLGGRAPLPADLLRAAAPGYCTSAQQAEAPASWFEQALAYATAKLHGAAAALAPAAGAGMGQVTGYTVADFLLQHASRERRPARVPASTWDALLSHLRDPADAARLADSAHGRLLYRYAIPLYRRAADAGDGYAAERLAGLLYNRGDLDQLRARADAGDRYAAEQLAELLANRADVDRLRAGADAGDGAAAGLGAQYPSWPGRGGDVDGLRARADAGDGAAAVQLAELLARARGPGSGRAAPARPGRRRRRVRRHAAGRAAGRPRGPGPAARPGRRRRPVCRLAAGRSAGRVRGSGQAAGPDRRQAAGRAAGRARGPGPAARPGRRRRRYTPPCGWPRCWPTAGTWTSCAPRPTPATGMPPSCWPIYCSSAATWTSCGSGPTPATGPPPCGWPRCWPSAGTWTSCAPGPTPATGTPTGRWPGCWPSAGTWTGCAPRPTPATSWPPSSWPTCWPSAGTWTSCAPGPTPATYTPPGGWPSAGTWIWIRPSSSCAPGPTPATSTPPCSWPRSWPRCWRGGARARKRSGCAGSV